MRRAGEMTLRPPTSFLTGTLFPVSTANAIHRDLETVSVKLRPDGTVKALESGEAEMQIREQPIAQASFLIRKPLAEVCEAFAIPDVTTKFWLERSTGRLEEGASLRWYFTPDLSTEVRVLDVSETERILIEWGVDSDNPTNVEWTFVPRSDDTTVVKVVNQGFSGDGDTIVNDALDSTRCIEPALVTATGRLT